jgi:hypothetical protein
LKMTKQTNKFIQLYRSSFCTWQAFRFSML